MILEQDFEHIINAACTRLGLVLGKDARAALAAGARSALRVVGRDCDLPDIIASIWGCDPDEREIRDEYQAMHPPRNSVRIVETGLWTPRHEYLVTGLTAMLILAEKETVVARANLVLTFALIGYAVRTNRCRAAAA